MGKEMSSLLSGPIWGECEASKCLLSEKQRPHCVPDCGFNLQATEGAFSWGDADLAGPQMQPAFFVAPVAGILVP